MEAISLTKLHELVDQIPDDRVPDAFRMLRNLTETLNNDSTPQAKALKLSLSDRRKLLAKQADQMREYYETTVGERQEWQSGDFHDDD